MSFRPRILDNDDNQMKQHMLPNVLIPAYMYITCQEYHAENKGYFKRGSSADESQGILSMVETGRKGESQLIVSADRDHSPLCGTSRIVGILCRSSSIPFLDPLMRQTDHVRHIRKAKSVHAPCRAIFNSTGVITRIFCLFEIITILMATDVVDKKSSGGETSCCYMHRYWSSHISGRIGGVDLAS